MVKTFQLTWRQLTKNKGRAILTIFGVTIGVAVVILVLSAGNGVKRLIIGELDSFGSNWINIEVKVPSTGKISLENIQSMAGGVTITTLTLDDAKHVLALDNISDVYAGVTTQAIFEYGTEKKQPTIFAVTASYANIDSGTVIKKGRFYSEEEDMSASEVIVLGPALKETLFGNDEAVGKNIKVGGKSFMVIGELEERGATGFFNYDEIAYIPLQTAQKKMMGINHILFMIAQMKDGDKSDATAEEIMWIIRERHGITDPEKDDFSVTTQQESVEMINTIFLGIQTLLVILGAISLIVGGVGIMNVMYVSVVERTFEIGLRKAVGAREKEIRRQFLTEAVVLTMFGGIIGIAVGIVLSFFMALGGQYAGLNWQFAISIPSIFIGTSFSIGIGLIFGYFPAKKAATLDPILALRHE